MQPEAKQAYGILGLILALTTLAWGTALWGYPDHRLAFKLGLGGFAVGLLLTWVFLGFMASKGLRRGPWGWTLAWLALLLLVSNQLPLAGGQGRLWTGFEINPATGWYLQPNLHEMPLVSTKGQTYPVTSDALGHRNQHPYPADGRLPYLVQGDSNLMGYGLEYADTLCEQLNRLAGAPLF